MTNNDSSNKHLSDEEIEARLWEYIDGITETDKQHAIKKLIAENALWRAKYQELLELHQLVQSSDLEEPSMRFSKNVMEEIARVHIAPAAKTYINKKVIWGIAGFFITVIVSFLLYAIAQVNWSEGTSTNGIGIDLTKVDYSVMFNNNLINLFMMVNVVLGLILLDRYLAYKKQQFTKEA